MIRIFKLIIKFITNKDYRFAVLAGYGFYKNIPDEIYLKRLFNGILNYKLNLDNPQTFNEKLQWLKLYNRNPIYTSMVDKCDAKKYVANIIGNEYIIPSLGLWDKFDEIDFNSLPNQFVLKCTHDSGGIIIVKDKKTLEFKKVRAKIEHSMKKNYYYEWREWPYKNIKPRIIAEKYMKDQNNDNLLDYKFMCFNGKVKCIFICSDRYSDSGLKVTFFNKNWNKMPFERHYPSSNKLIPKPLNYELMIELAEKLSKGVPFLRVDFYEVNGKIYFGELTFYPGSGVEEFTPIEWDYILGSWIQLPEKKE